MGYWKAAVIKREGNHFKSVPRAKPMFGKEQDRKCGTGSVVWGGVWGRDDNMARLSSWRPGRTTAGRTGLEGRIRSVWDLPGYLEVGR